jgi:heme O synthase-like polyprenyltransferase
MFLRAGWQCATLPASGLIDRASARRLFFASIIYLPLLLTALAIDRV